MHMKSGKICDGEGCIKKFNISDNKNIEYVPYWFLICGFSSSYEVRAEKIYKLANKQLLCSDCMAKYVEARR